MNPSLFDEPKTPVKSLDPDIEPSWKSALMEEFQKPYFAEIKAFLLKEREDGRTVYPRGKEIFNAFNSTPFDQVKVVIIGQDPYHGKGQAHGLCFSVPDGIAPPPSLVNIYKEINDDLEIPVPSSGNLSSWAKQGVLLLNAILTVRAGQAASHHEAGWESFTDAAIRQLSEKKEGIVFLLWGKYAQDKALIIDGAKHHMLMAPHPSPFSANSGFFGCKHFSQVNELLEKQGMKLIDWAV
ncbi:MAG: uracil-DNA glycosylase [Bacteroidetes bacterium]|nr:uracil-DNA glycosylase [Bacteroidota bacterium]